MTFFLNILTNIGFTLFVSFIIALPHHTFLGGFDLKKITINNLEDYYLIGGILLFSSTVLLIFSRYEFARKCFRGCFIVLYISSFLIFKDQLLCVFLLLLSGITFLRWTNIDKFVWMEDFPGEVTLGKLDIQNESLKTINLKKLNQKKEKHNF